MSPASQCRYQKNKRGIAERVPPSPNLSMIDSTAGLDYRS